MIRIQFVTYTATLIESAIELMGYTKHRLIVVVIAIVAAAIFESIAAWWRDPIPRMKL